MKDNKFKCRERVNKKKTAVAADTSTTSGSKQKLKPELTSRYVHLTRNFKSGEDLKSLQGLVMGKGANIITLGFHSALKK